MTKEQIRAVFDRIPGWPIERQQEIAELALEIEAELASGEYSASTEELQAIEDGLASGLATAEEVAEVFARLRRR